MKGNKSMAHIPDVTKILLQKVFYADGKNSHVA